ncbi:maleylpyruvate isomerase N-terminal domain-containing protein [Actinomadura kijaniata]|uniref:maleylpyruvate isomerase N-terminal domain-containing protein n=1 Tax=Actinomadura kijaniata TaxID=46161 RepID=UPI003F19B5E7
MRQSDALVPITPDRWRLARTSLETAGDRFAGLLERASRSSGGATADWSIGDTAAHVATVAECYLAIVDPGAPPFPYPAAEGLVEKTVVDTVDRLNEVLLGHFTERDPARIAPLLRGWIDGVLDVTAASAPDTPVPWLGGSRVPLAGVVAHLTNELNVHGRDIARAARLPWTIPPRDAALFFELFLLGVMHYGYGRLLDGHGPVSAGRIAVEFRSRYTTPRVMALTDGFVTVEHPGENADVRLWSDPVGLDLMLFGRISRARAALTGKVVVRGGRRPWRLPAFLRIVHLPS